jgi:hypothetical protein
MLRGGRPAAESTLSGHIIYPGRGGGQRCLQKGTILGTPAMRLSGTRICSQLGARWGAHLHLAPLLVSSADTALLRGPLAATNALSCDSPAQVHQLVADVASSLGARAGSPATYQKAVEALVSLSRSRVATRDVPA